VNTKMLALYGLKGNPFMPNVPTEALHVTTRLESFCWRVQQLAGVGGFALVAARPAAASLPPCASCRSRWRRSAT
jgi:hypothetical protein